MEFPSPVKFRGDHGPVRPRCRENGVRTADDGFGGSWCAAGDRGFRVSASGSAGDDEAPGARPTAEQRRDEMPPVREHEPVREQADDSELILYQVVASRQQSYEDNMWQAPGLALTAQAFLMTIALGAETDRLARMAAGLLAAMISLISIQLLLRHRVGAVADAIWLEEFEQSHGWTVVHDRSNKRFKRMGIQVHGLARMRSHRIWIYGLITFAVVGVASAFSAVFSNGGM